MSLSIVLGNSSNYKSISVYKRIIKESIAHPNKNYLIIVPEQYTMSTQRLLVSLHPDHCIMNIDVLAFNRLAYRVLDELSVGLDTVLDDTGKSLVIRKLVDDNLDKLVALKKNMTKVSYIAQVKSLISEMTQYNNSPDKLQEMINYKGMSENFKRKSSDLLVLYEAYLDYIDGRYATSETMLSTLNSCIADSGIVAGSTVVFDGFTGFTPIQYDLVETMMKICEEVIVTITADANSSISENVAEDDLFFMSHEFYKKLNDRAKAAKTEISVKVELGEDTDSKALPKPLKHLEENIFRNSFKCYLDNDACDAISLISLRNTRDELKYVADTIGKYIKTGSYRYKDFAIVCPDIEQYRYHVDEAFKGFEIPYFIDTKTEILFHPFIEALDSIFDIFSMNFRRDDVFRFLRTGLTDLTLEEIDILENYVISTGIRGKNKYFHPFAIRSNSFSEDEQMLLVNEIREKFIGPFVKLGERLGKKKVTVREIAVAIYEFLLSFDCEKKIKQRQLLHEENGNLVRAKEYSQIYKVVMDILDEMVSILGDEQMELDEFAQIYKAGLSAAAIGVIPPANDSVIIGDIERTRINDIKILFCIGISDEAVPKKVENGGILSQLEREQLLEANFDLAPSDKQKAFRQRFYLYLMLTKPSEHLYLTTPRVNKDANAVRPSYLIETIKKMFSSLQLEELESLDEITKLSNEGEAINYLISMISKTATLGLASLSEEEKQSLISLISWAKYSDKVNIKSLFETAFFMHSDDRFSQDIVLAINEALNEDEIVSGSVSKFERYSECAYKYFLTYVLKLSEREEFKLSNIDMGNFYHEAIQRYSDSLKTDKIKWKDVSEEQQEAYIAVAIDNTIEQFKKIATLEDASQRYVVDTMKETLHHMVSVITEQVKRGCFEPESFEEKITADIYDPLTNEKVAKLHGKVDRIDLTDSADKAVRIIDYKSSEHKLSLSECYYGLSLQLPVYMGVVLEKLKSKYPNSTAHPAAMLYSEIGNDFVDVNADEINDETIAEKRLEANKLQGLLSLDPSDLMANDATVGVEPGQSLKSLIVKYSIKKDKKISSTTSGISQENMNLVVDYSKVKSSEIAQDILLGKFPVKPVVHEKTDACKYCPYPDVCGYVKDAAGFSDRTDEKLSDEAALALMKEKLDEIKGETNDGTN